MKTYILTLAFLLVIIAARPTPSDVFTAKATSIDRRSDLRFSLTLYLNAPNQQYAFDTSFGHAAVDCQKGNTFDISSNQCTASCKDGKDCYSEGNQCHCEFTDIWDELKSAVPLGYCGENNQGQMWVYDGGVFQNLYCFYGDLPLYVESVGKGINSTVVFDTFDAVAPNPSVFEIPQDCICGSSQKRDVLGNLPQFFWMN
eukprot:TRINITY_DN1265_c0_g1_i1.p1 TRINITY_DN1265_c0_g1~~TRINITY_DN1265_c0_g1_i1.p1  ORF type:complete len:219 (+),score=39.26 TRINITY_DN1265_c0_g1_i1:59-658(+)